MRDFNVALKSEPSKSFRCQKAADSLDIDTNKKLSHSLRVSADVDTPYNVGLIVGASGSGKTTLARVMAEQDFESPILDLSKPIIDQFPEGWTYDECATALSGVGLTQVVCWLRPAGTLSNGQRARADVAIRLAQDETVTFIDEWTSVVDRTVAKVMSHSVQKFARKANKRVVLISCHYDVIDWLQPDWVIDCNRQKFVDWRLERPAREENLRFDIARADRKSWQRFSQYHYLSEKLPGGHIETYGIYYGGEQIGFQCFANYTPHRKGTVKIMHSNRTVIHPDYAGFGLGIRVIDATSADMKARGYRPMAKFSSVPIFKSMSKSKNWQFKKRERAHKVLVGGNAKRNGGFRVDVTTFSFEYVGCSNPQKAIE